MIEAHEFTVNICPRVRMRMACIEGTCQYPFSEAAIPTDPSVPHFDEELLRTYISGDNSAEYSHDFTSELMRRLGIARVA